MSRLDAVVSLKAAQVDPAPFGLGSSVLPPSRRAMLRADGPSATRVVDGAVTVIGDLRLDNGADLAARLGLAHSSSDAHIVLIAYRRWGREFVNELFGDFALALWDDDEQLFLCARDLCGSSPLYYGVRSDCLHVGSDLLETADRCGERTVDVGRIGSLLVGDLTDRRTVWRGVRSLGAGEVLQAEGGSFSSTAYWSPERISRLPDSARADHPHLLAETLAAAVRSRLPATGRVGTNLSGGLDSSSVSGVAASMIDVDRHHTFTAVFPSLSSRFPEIDESEYVGAFLADAAATPHEVVADDARPLAAASSLTEPGGPPSTYMTSLIHQACDAADVRVLLSGFGGDEVVGLGLEHLGELAEASDWDAFGATARRLVDRRPWASERRYLAVYGAPALRSKLHRAQLRTVVSDLRRASSALQLPIAQVARSGILSNYGQSARAVLEHLRLRSRGVFAARGGQHRAIRHDFASSLGLRDQLAAASEVVYASSDHPVLEPIRAGRFETVARVTDQIGRRTGVRQLFPFLDRRMIELAVATPNSWRIHEGWTRWPLRAGMQAVVPPDIRWRTTKADLSANVRICLRQELDAIDAIVLAQPDVVAEYVVVDVVREIRDRLVAAPTSLSEADLFTLFNTVTLGSWLLEHS